MSDTPRTATIELAKEAFKFSAGHFTIFSATHRERMHGHNFVVGCELTGQVTDEGLIADYRTYKRALMELCRAWNERFLLPSRSPFLAVDVGPREVTATFDGQRMVFPKDDVQLLPVANVTLEELSWTILHALVGGALDVEGDRLSRVVVRVSSGPGQWAASHWDRPDDMRMAR